MPLPSIRQSFFLIAAACCSMIIAAMIMQYTLDMEPCPLCISQRVFVILAGLIAVAAALQNPQQLGRKIYSVTGLAASLIGGGISSRHLWIQNLPEDQVPTCGPGIGYMFETLPIWDALSLLFAGDGNCADVVWRFGLTIPGWTLVGFVGLGTVFIWQFLRKSHSV